MLHSLVPSPFYAFTTLEYRVQGNILTHAPHPMPSASGYTFRIGKAARGEDSANAAPELGDEQLMYHPLNLGTAAQVWACVLYPVPTFCPCLLLLHHCEWA